MELFTDKYVKTPVCAALFDFDGTVSTLRHGWEAVMKPLMVEMIAGDEGSAELTREIDAYIDESTGIQTIHQMKWLAERAHAANPERSTDPWWYKAEYNRRLMEGVEKKIQMLNNGLADRDEFLVGGSEAFLRALKEKGVKLYVASGTDHPDVVREAGALGVAGYFDMICGAPLGEESCSKEAVIARLIKNEGLSGDEFAVIGDGKVEIRLGREAGARTLGMATDEDARHGVNPVKRERLIRAGADAISGDFLDINAIMGFLGYGDI